MCNCKIIVISGNIQAAKRSIIKRFHQGGSFKNGHTKHASQRLEGGKHPVSNSTALEFSNDKCSKLGSSIFWSTVWKSHKERHWLGSSTFLEFELWFLYYWNFLPITPNLDSYICLTWTQFSVKICNFLRSENFQIPFCKKKLKLINRNNEKNGWLWWSITDLWGPKV